MLNLHIEATAPTGVGLSDAPMVQDV